MEGTTSTSGGASSTGLSEAIAANAHARGAYRAIGDRHREGRAWHDLGNALRDAGQVDEEIAAFTKDLEICREFEDWYGAGQTLEQLGRIRKAAHRPAEARTYYLQAVHAYTRANAPTEASNAQSAADALT